jgi:hypothetical protein
MHRRPIGPPVHVLTEGNTSVCREPMPVSPTSRGTGSDRAYAESSFAGEVPGCSGWGFSAFGDRFDPARTVLRRVPSRFQPEAMSTASRTSP